jgi:hypothetical protein
MKYKVGDKIIGRMYFTHIQRIYVGKIEQVWEDVNRVRGKILDSTQFPEYNAISWNDHFLDDEDDVLPYNEATWRELLTLSHTIRESISKVESILVPKPTPEAKE